MMRVVDTRHLLIEVVPALSPDDWFDQYPIVEPITDDWRHMMADTMAAHHRDPEMPPHA